MEEFTTNSISASITKGSVDEEMSLLRASLEDAASRLADGMKPETISNVKSEGHTPCCLLYPLLWYR